YYGDHWNIIGFSHKREAIRNFVLDHMADIKILDETFVPYGNINTRALIYRTDEASHEIEVAVHNSVIRRFEANLPAKINERYNKTNHTLNIRFSFNNLDFINEWLLQFPKTVTIVSPKILIEKRNKLLREMINA